MFPTHSFPSFFLFFVVIYGRLSMIMATITFKDSGMRMLEFVLSGESNLYRVSGMGDYAIVTTGSNELFNAGTPNLRKTLVAYLRRRFRDFQIMDFSEENIEAVCEDMNISLQFLSSSFFIVMYGGIFHDRRNISRRP